MSETANKLATLTPEQRRELEAKLLQKQFAQKKERVIPRRAAGSGSLPLSFAQQRLWFLDQLEPNSSFYNIFKAVRLSGKLNVPALERTLETIVARHESLRTTFQAVAGEPIQIITEKFSPKLQIVDLESSAAAEREAEALRRAQVEARTPFDLKCGPLFRPQLLRLGPEEHWLLLTIHHIVCDGWSMAILIRELTQLYTAFCEGKPSPLAELPVQYGDYAVWQRTFLQGETLSKQIDYWKDKLAGLPVMEMPTDHARPPVQTFHGKFQPVAIARPVADALQPVIRQERATLFMTLLAAFQAVLHRYTGQDEVVVGSPLAGRTRSEIEGLIGFFVNTRVLRTDVSENPSFREFLRRVRDVCLEADAHQDVPFEKLVEELQPQRDPSRTPLFQISFQLQNLPRESLDLPGLRLCPVEAGNENAKFDLSLTLSESPEGFRGGFVYNTDLFEPATIERLTGHLQTLVGGIAANPDARLGDLPLLTAEEERELLIDWNRPALGAASGSLETIAANSATQLHQLFETQAARTPDAVALVCEDKRLTYRELNERANQVAHYLRGVGVGSDVIVGICLDRSLELVIGLLGILKAGGAYLPIDLSYPADRLAFMLEDAQAPVLLTQTKLTASLPASQAKILCLDGEALTLLREQPTSNPVPCGTPDDLAYVIFTSGSTGKPKGALITHRNVTRLMRATEQWFGFNERDVWTLFHSYAFDFSVWEIWGALLYGGRLVVVPFAVSRSPEAFCDLLAREQVTVLNQTPSAFRQLIQAEEARPLPEPLALRFVIFGGEALELQSLKPWFDRHGDQRPQLVNMYGITETTVHVTYRPLTKNDLAGGSVIGVPIPDLQIYILDRFQRPVPIGVPGEMFVGGAGLARGYLNRPELTNERFIANPFWNQNGSKLYRTGDRARWLPQRDVEYLGRIDHQVKLRGFRIELGEIEAVLCSHPAVREAVVLVREDTPGDKRLAAYLVTSGGTPAAGELRAHVKQKLPDYMVPAAFVFLDKFPLTNNGKIDRKVLPAPEITRGGDDFLAPRSALELELKNVWEEILGVRPIGMRDNFFELGGHSLLAVKLFVKVEEVTGKKLPLATLFQAPTIEQFAEILHREHWSPTWNSLIAIQPSGNKTPLFLVHGVGGNILNYQPMAKRLAPDQPVYAMQSVGMDGKQPPLKSVEEMAAAYIKEMRALQPHGPYYLGGMSFGGMVIWEMAQQLTAQGERIGLLAMLDVSPWGLREHLGQLEVMRLKALSLFYRIRYNLIGFFSVPWREKIIFIQKKKKTLKRRLKSRQWQREYMQMLREGHTLPPGIQNVKEANFLAAGQYEPQPYEGKVTVFRGVDKMMNLGIDPRIGWRHLARGGVDLHDVPGDHLTLLEEPNAEVLVEKIRGCLAAKQLAPTCVHQFFEEQAQRTPDATAVISGETTLSYRELNERADQLAAHLRALGVGPETRVGLCVARSPEMMIAVLGILKAGGAYVPMDFAYPKDRLRFMLEDSRAPVLLTQRKLALELPATSAKVVFLDEPLPALGKSAPTTDAQPASTNLAYVIYTSGSTGRPKGVAMPHRPLVNLIEWQCKESQLPPGAKTLQFASLSFDVSFQEMFSTWAAGGTLVLITEEMRQHPGVLLGFMQKEEVARLFLPFVALQHIAQAVEDTGIVPATLREVITAGEQLQISPAIQNLFQKIPEATLYNHYGPSETHVVTSYRLEGPPQQWMSLPPIGRPIPRVKIVLLDSDLKPVKDGESGELHVGGVALAHGYLERPELTGNAFIKDPFSAGAAARLYKTGDLARWLPDGNLEFLGRKDAQVKIRGFRIEPGEIETVIGQHPKVRAAAVTVYEPTPGDKRLVAYAVGQPNDKPSVNELRAFLGERLADYMIPTAFVLLDALPLTPSGKVDRRSLPVPDQNRPALEKEFVEPRDKLEQDLKAIWEQVLGVKPVGIRDNFFELGGHSLLAARLFTLMEKATNRKLPLAILFQAPTIETCAELLRRENWSPRSSALVPLQARGAKPPLFLVHGVGGNVLNFRRLAKYLGESQPFYGLQSLGLDGQQAPLTEITEMAQAYLREVRAVQPKGPYRLGGMSFGGMVAWEMARALVNAGEKVELLALLDVDPWGAGERLGKLELIRLSLLAWSSSVTQNWRHFVGLPFGQKLDYLRGKKKTLGRRLRSRFWQRHYMKELRSGRALPPSLNNVKEANFLAEKKYRPQPYRGHVTVFVASDRFIGATLGTRAGWQGLALGGVTLRDVPGDHLSMVEEPHVQVLANTLKQCLDKPPA